MIIFLYCLVIFYFLEILYFKIASKYNIIDKPNQRSSHTSITLRGGGIVFPLATILGVILYQPNLYLLAFAVFIIGTISFLDDILTISNKLRLLIHFTAVSIVLFLSKEYYSFLDPIYLYTFLIIAFIVIIGVINAYNFMDGINGITVLYSSISIISVFFIQNILNVELLKGPIYLLILASLIVFGFFNLRKKAKAFSGDVGSISIALILCFLIFKLILITEDLKWVLLLGVYGLDAVATIFCRLVRKENIFEAHRSHFYQFLANEKKISHVTVSICYALVQLLLNLIVLYSTNVIIYGSFILLIVIYIGLRFKFEGKEKLFKQYSV